MSFLQVEGLRVSIRGVPILRGVDLEVAEGGTLGIVGESGCGKSMTALALMGMLPPGAAVESGSIRLGGRDLSRASESEWRSLRGREIALVMQDPFTSLNPMMRVGDQIAEVYRLHQKAGPDEARRKAVEMLERVGIPDPEGSARKHPHRLSGGQRQRVVIAIAFAARPRLLIADEPTTALDVTLQAQILRLLREMQRETGTTVVLISHDIGVIGAMSEQVAVFYAGRVVESGSAERVLRRPMHPYTIGLLDSMPDHALNRLKVIPGRPPMPGEIGEGCAFAPRCGHRIDICGQDPPAHRLPDGVCACRLAAPSELNA